MSVRCCALQFILAFLICRAGGGATTYYVSNTGSDTNPGTSVSTPWRSIQKVNANDFHPGDAIRFFGGQSFVGTLQFGAPDSGTATSPVTISSYGTGHATINGGKDSGFFAYNCSGLLVSNLNFVGNGPTVNTNDGVLFFSDLINVPLLPAIIISAVEVSGFGGQGISLGAINSGTGYSNVTIIGCSVHNNLQGGILTYAQNPYTHKNVYVGYCQAYNNFGDPAASGNTGNGIVLGNINGGTIEYCVAHDNGKNNFAPGEGPVGIWCYDSQSVALQFNESHHNHTSTFDGGGLDLDINTKNSVVQFNYSHDNDGAGYLLCCDGNNSNNVVRYNISQNDARKNGYSSIRTYGAIRNASIFNNTVFISNISPTPSAIALTAGTLNVRVQNNIFQTSGGAVLASIASGQSGFAMQGNDYWPSASSFVITDSGTTYPNLTSWRGSTGREKLNGTNTGFNVDPRLLNAGAGGTFNDATLLPTLTAYRLQTNSPMLDTGLNLPMLGVDAGTRDFYGTSVAQGIGFDIGASETKRDIIVKGTKVPPNFRIDAVGTINKTNVLEASTNLALWFVLTNTTSGTIQFTDTNASRNPQRYYRLKQ